MEVRLKKSDGSNVVYGDSLYPITNLAHTLIKQLSVHVNSVLLEPQTDHYHYKAFFQTMLNNNRNDGETLLAPQGWYNDFDTPSQLTNNTIDSTHNDYKNMTDSQKNGLTAMKKARLPSLGGKLHTLFFAPTSPLFHTGKLLVPQQEVSIKMYFNDPNIYLVSGAMDMVMDSFAICLTRYDPPTLFHWVMDQLDGFECNRHPLQAVDNQACGLYALMFLVHMSVGGTLESFTDTFSRHDYVKNDHRVAQWGQGLVERDLSWHAFVIMRKPITSLYAIALNKKMVIKTHVSGVISVADPVAHGS